MPILDFKGKQFVYTHHLSVPFRTLEIDPVKSLSRDGTPSLDDNLIIHGDNLHALKALLPTYAGKVNCIYIDPPYNTGTEGWCYSDRVNSPLMREWLKKEANPVDKEDLERHDKWLSMMWPRLQLLRELLADDGAIFISIDDNEAGVLRVMMDEIFGESNFVANFVWQSKDTPGNNSSGVAETHNHILFYRKSDLFKPSLLERSEDQIANYSNPDNDPRGDWLGTPLTRAEYRERDYYPLKNKTGREVYPPKGSSWRRPPQVLRRLESEDRIYWGKDGNAEFPVEKKFLKEVKSGVVNQTWWPYTFAGSTRNASAEIKAIFGEKIFDTPKPALLIKRILEIATDDDSLVLDSFAGSGTTAHAVLALNKEDDGNRRFILVEMEDYADRLTAERVRRVMSGYESEEVQHHVLFEQNITYTRLKNADRLLKEIEEIEAAAAPRFDTIRKEVKEGVLIVTGEKQVTEHAEGLGGSFTFCTLGEEINVTSLLKGNDLPSYESLARYVFFTATGKTLGDLPKRRPDWFIGETDLYRVHLIYQPDREFLRGQEAALNAEMVDIITGGKGVKAPKKALVFASVKFMGQRELTERNIEFCQIPYAIHRILGD